MYKECFLINMILKTLKLTTTNFIMIELILIKLLLLWHNFSRYVLLGSRTRVSVDKVM